MKIYEILKFNRELINKILILGVRPEDCQYVDLYSDYKIMHDNAQKMTYIVASLSIKYHVSERKIYYIIDEMEKDCNVDAV